MFYSRIATTIVTFCLFAGLSISANAQVECNCSRSSLMGVTVGTLLNNDFHGPVSTVVGTGIELPNAGPTLHAAGPAPRWNIDFGANTIRIDFVSGPATYGAGSKFTFSGLTPIPPPPCQSKAHIVGMTVTTNKSSAAYVSSGATFTSSSVVVPFAPPNASVDWNTGEYILVTLRFDCDPQPPPVDPCCPPWNSTMLKDMMFYQGSGGISAPYTLKFQPTAAFNAQMLAYLSYLHAMNPLITSITIKFDLEDGGTGTSGTGGPIVPGGGPFTATWTYPNSSPSPSFFAASLSVNHWYRVNTVISLNNGQHFFSDQCANRWIDVNLQVQGNLRVMQIRSADGHTSERRINVGDETR